MREGLIVLPHTVSVEHHKNLQDKLIAAFGGFTAVTAQGAWKDPVYMRYADGNVLLVDRGGT